MKQNLLKSLWLIALLLVVGNVSAQDEGQTPSEPATFKVYSQEHRNGTMMTKADFVTYQSEHTNAMALVTFQDANGRFDMDSFKFVVDESISNIDNVIIEFPSGSGGKSYECKKLHINDLDQYYEDWVSPVETFNVVTSLVYQRNLSSSGLNSVCLPFKVTSSDLPPSPVGEENRSLMLKFSGKIEDNYAYFGNYGEAEPGHAFFLKCTSTGQWTIDKKVSSGNPISISSVIPSGDMLVGSYKKQQLFGDNKYKLSGGKLVYIDPNGGSHLYPFRAYLAPMENTMPVGGNGVGPAPTLNMVIEDSEATSISNTNINDSQIISEVFNVNGVKQSELKKGVNIVRMSDGSIKKIIKK